MVMEDIWSGDIWIDPQRTKHLYHPCNVELWSIRRNPTALRKGELGVFTGSPSDWNAVSEVKSGMNWSLVGPNDGEGNGTPLQYSCLENPMDGGAWWAAVHGVAKSPIRLSDFTFTFHFHALEKEMATHSSVLAWRIPGTTEPGGLLSMGSHRVGHNWSDLAAAAAGPNDNPLQFLAWRIPWTEKPGGLQSTGSQRVGHD